jgi:hypothetical protein
MVLIHYLLLYSSKHCIDNITWKAKHQKEGVAFQEPGNVNQHSRLIELMIDGSHLLFVIENKRPNPNLV